MHTVHFMNWDCYIKFGQYQNGRIAMQLFDVEDHEPVCTVTVNLPDEDVPDGYVLIKDWSENEGIYDVLHKAGIIGKVERKIPTGHVLAYQCKLCADPEEKT